MELERKRATLLVVNQFPSQSGILDTMVEGTCVFTGTKGMRLLGAGMHMNIFNR